jgi:predicted carbohydrate-binding protein with CBM5 and CBM33 domain
MTTPAPVTPTLSIAADKATYNVGDVLTLTASYSDASVSPMTLTINASATDAAGNTVTASTEVTVNTQTQQAMNIGVSDSAGDQYVLVSNDAGVAVLTTTVQAPPAA